MIVAKETDGVIYYSTIYRGIKYFTYYMQSREEWCLSSQRLALGPYHIGGYKFYKTIDDLCKSCKAFQHLNALIN